MESAARIDFDDGRARALEIALCLGVLAFFAPLMLIVALVIKLGDGGPVLFAHPRIGRWGRPFHCLKFRSMAVDSEAQLQALLARDAEARAEWERDHKLTHDPRITPFGQFLRRSSLDELPQLINVLRGEMSLVGPRPIVQAEVARYRRYFKYYCQVRPGITGLWQVSGRSTLAYRRRVALDVVYARSRCIALDFKILLATAPAVLGRRGAR